MNKERLSILFGKYISKTCTEKERIEFSELLLDTENLQILDNLLMQSWDTTTGYSDMDLEKAEEIIRSILNSPEKKTGRIRHMWVRWAAAASIVGLLLVSGYWFIKSEKSKVKSEKEVAVIHDVPAPNVARATLKLDDGRIVYLDSVDNGQLAMQGNVSVVKLGDGKISYESSDHSQQATVTYNTISNPRGSKVQTLTLIDGTQVWLNAESSITYPTAFVGNERKISMTGEAYFEVKHDASKKFIVDANGTTTEVLGTHFNVNAYDDEDAVRVTLLEGSVVVKSEVGSPKSEVTITPGQQAIAVQNSALRVKSDIDVEQVTAWKNGLFEFNNTTLPVIMRQIGRWYDLEIVYEGTLHDLQLGGGINRTASLQDVLKMLESNGAQFKLDGRKLIVQMK